MEQFIFFDEAAQAGVPLPLMALNTVGPTIMRFGTEQQKTFFLPKILSGEIDFAIGYSEPDAGTDLASLKTRAVRDGEGNYVVDGQKIWTTNGDTADWVWLAVRTDPGAPLHKGITMLLVPTSDPGYSCTLIRTLASHDTTASYYENVRVPLSHRVGEENEGWRLITNQLNHERVTLAAHGTMAIRALHDVQRWAMETKLADGRRVIDLSWVRRHLARTHTKLDALKLLNWRMVNSVQEGTLTPPGRLGRQGLRLRGPPRRLRLAHGDRGRRGRAEGGIGRRRAPRRAGARLPFGRDLHLPRWQQRDPARDHLLDRPGDAEGAQVTPVSCAAGVRIPPSRSTRR
jgi:alkylation response protein AidB-like acyl-CoA dehydrogenase